LAPLFVRTLFHLKQDNVRGDPYKSSLSDSSEEMLDRFGLDPDSRLALVVERAVQGAGIEVDSSWHKPASL